MASSATPSWVKQKYIAGNGSGWLKIMKIILTADTDGSFTDYTLDTDYINGVKYMSLNELYVDPSTPQATNGSNIEIQKVLHGNADIFESGLYGLSNTTAARFAPPTVSSLMYGDLIITWSGNNVNGAKMDLYLYFK